MAGCQDPRTENDPIADEEFIYRRIPLNAHWYNPHTGQLLPQVFAPHKVQDQDGLSVTRSKYNTVEQAALGRPGKSYYVAVLRASDLRRYGIVIRPDPQPHDPGHALLPELNSANRQASETLEKQRVLASLCLRVEGPFLTPDLST